MSQSQHVEEVIPKIIEYMHDKFGDHVFNPKKFVLNDTDAQMDQKIKEIYSLREGR